MKQLDNKSITIIGAGNMGAAIARGLLNQQYLKPKELTLSDPHTDHLSDLAEVGVTLTADNQAAAQAASIIILAIKPQILSQVLKQLSLKQDQLLISIAAGITLTTLEGLTAPTQPIIRVMPNLPATVGAAMSGWFPNAAVSPKQKQLTEQLLSCLGHQLICTDETQLDVITAISGSGPAYLFFLTQLLQQAATNQGFSNADATLLARQTIIGSAMLLNQSSQTPSQLRESVTSPGGTTQAALRILQSPDFINTFYQAIQAAIHRSQELSK